MEPAPARQRLGIRVALLVAVVVGLSCWAVQRGRQAAHLELLRDHVRRCVAAGRSTATPWRALPTMERLAVCRALLDQPRLVWLDTLQDDAVTATLVWVLRHDRDPIRRAHAARVLGQLAARTSPPAAPEPLPDGLRRVIEALEDAADTDAEQVVRLAASAAWVRIRPLGRAYGLTDSWAGGGARGSSEPSDRSR